MVFSSLIGHHRGRFFFGSRFALVLLVVSTFLRLVCPQAYSLVVHKRPRLRVASRVATSVIHARHLKRRPRQGQSAGLPRLVSVVPTVCVVAGERAEVAETFRWILPPPRPPCV